MRLHYFLLLVIAFSSGCGTKPQPKPVALLASAASATPGLTESDAVLAIRASIAAGGVIAIPPGEHVLLDTLVVGNGVVRLSGDGAESCILLYKGPTDRPALHVDAGVWNATIGNFTLRNYTANPESRRMQGVGIAAYQRERPQVYAGTVCGSNRYENLVVADFEYGFRGGDAGYSATSENRFYHCSFYDCREGVRLVDYNTLNNHFQDVNFTGGDVGIACGPGGGETHISGGSASNVGRPGSAAGGTGVVFAFASGGGYSVEKFRQGEGGEATFCKSSGTNTVVAIRDCTILGTSPWQRRAIEVYYDSVVAVRNCRIDGHVAAGRLSGSLLVEQCWILEPRKCAVETSYPPLPGRKWRVEERGNVNYSTGQMELMPDGITKSNP